MKQQIVFFGSGEYTMPVIEKIIPHGLDLVTTTEKKPSSPLLNFCNKNNLKTVSVSSSANEAQDNNLSGVLKRL